MPIRARIKRGTPVFHDHWFFKWPEADPRAVDTVFDVEETDNGFKLVADGWGRLDKPDAYGSGAVFVTKFSHLEGVQDA